MMKIFDDYIERLEKAHKERSKNMYEMECITYVFYNDRKIFMRKISSPAPTGISLWDDTCQKWKNVQILNMIVAGKSYPGDYYKKITLFLLNIVMKHAHIRQMNYR